MGKLIFEYSSMNAGKTIKLLITNHSFQSIGENVIILKPSLDDRSDKVESRVCPDSAINCTLIKTDFKINELLKEIFENDVKAILVDEAQFLTKQQVLDLRKLTDETDIDVICYGLRTDFQGNLFEGSQWLLARSDKLINHMVTKCHCGKKATMVLRLDIYGNVVEDGKQIDCGFEDKYISVCHKHWYEKTTTNI